MKHFPAESFTQEPHRTSVHYRGTSRIRNRTPPKDYLRTIGIGLLKGPRGERFLMREVPP